ncbi:hypothetical protein KQI63_07465 [bacterium]|nr:hypothetical protein [bacterium]
MRVAVPSDNERFIAAHTGRCLGFVIADVQGGAVNRIEYRRNSFTGHALGLHQEGGHQHGGGQGGGGQGLGMGMGSGQGQGQGHGHGHGHHHSHNKILSGLNDCQAMLALGMGPRLQQDLSEAGIEVFFTRDKQIDRVLQQLADGVFTSHPDGSACKEHQHQH